MQNLGFSHGWLTDFGGWHVSNTTCLKKTANLFLSELRQTYTNFDNIWQKDGKEAKIIRGALIFHLT